MDEQATAAVAQEAAGNRDKRVVYLLGAGATQACISQLGSRRNIVMSGLEGPIFEELRRRATNEKYADHSGIARLVNEVMVSESGLDIEHLITFLEDSPGEVYRQFSVDLRETFSSVLRGELDKIEQELGSAHSRLYAALIDMHNVDGIGESLRGFLTLNYDVVLEHAIEQHLRSKVDYGVTIGESSATDAGRSVRVLKMHGSFGWSQDWPIKVQAGEVPGCWIPPGLRKPKNEYPFNAIWGLARELLDCDVLRIIGCNLGPNDWDLVSLLFSTKHTHATAAPYRVEVISSLENATRIKSLFPYLDVRSLVELPRVGQQIISELIGAEPQSLEQLPEGLRTEVISNSRRAIPNPFSYWLTQMGEAMITDVGSIETEFGIFEQFIQSGR